MHGALSLYAHIPFCAAKCGYCDFNSYEGLDHLVPDYTPALIREPGAAPSVEFRPAYIDPLENRPRPASAEEAARILDVLGDGGGGENGR